MTSLMDQLFPDIGLRRLVGEHLYHRPAIAHGSLERFGDLARLPGLQDGAELIGRSPLPAAIVYRKTDGKVRQVRQNRADAVTAFRSGETVSLEAMERYHPVIEEWCAQVRDDLGHLSAAPSCAALVSGMGEAVPMHFDGVNLLVVQLTGRKRWTIAAPSVPYPRFDYFPTERGSGARAGSPGGFRPNYLPATFPTEMPASAVQEVLLPGSVLLLPAGYWHQTEALDISISLTFKIAERSLASYLIEALVRKLHEDPAWRAPAGSLFGSDAQLSAAREVISRSMAAFQTTSAALSADSVLDELVGVRIRKRSGVPIRVGRGSEELELSIEGGGVLASLPTDGGLDRLFEKLCACEEPFTEGTVLGWAQKIPESTRASVVGDLLLDLRQLGAIDFDGELKLTRGSAG